MRLYHQDKKQLKRLFGHRVRFDLAERRLYARDVSNPPAPVKMMIKTLPDAVVCPESEADLVDLLHFAKDRRVALVPRGGGTAGYGGAMPVRGGIVVDMTAMDQEFSLSGDGKLATLAAGMTFLDAEARLKLHGKALRAMPTSAAAATLGGWLAQGGAGLGSLRYGWFADTVDSVRVILPDGQMRTFAGREMDVISDMEGMTGFIVSVTVKVRADEPLTPVVATFADITTLQAGINAIRAGSRPWTMLIHDPEFNLLRTEATGQKNVPKGQFSLVMAFEQSALPEGGVADIETIVTNAGGKTLAADKAAAEWALRFGVFRAKRLGPSIVPGEAVMPTARTAEGMARIHEAVKAAHWCMEGIVAGDETVWFAFALDDERRPEFPAAFGASMSMLAAAKKVDGRSLGTGVYLSTEAGAIFSDDRIERVGQFRRSVDPEGIMNPGKVFGAKIRFAPSWAPAPSVAGALKPGEPLLKMVHGSTYVRYQRFDEARKPHRSALSVALATGGAAEFGTTWGWDAIVADTDVGIRHASASAGAFRTLSTSPLGWVRWARDYINGKGTITPYQYQMLHGEGYAAMAEARSELQVPYGRMFQDLKTHLVGQGFKPLPAHARMAEHVSAAHNVFGAPHAERAEWSDGLELTNKGDVLLFVDDAVSYKAPHVARNAEELLRRGGKRVAYLGAEEWSSAAALLHAGLRSLAMDTIKHNIEAINASGVSELVTPDAQAYQVLKNDYPALAAELGLKWNVKVFHLVEYAASLIDSGKLAQGGAVNAKVALHHPPILTVNGVTEEMARKVLEWIPGLEVVALIHNGAQALDVGASGGVAEAYPEIADKAARRVVQEAQAVGAELIVSSDPASELLIRRAGARMATEQGVDTTPSLPDLGAPVPPAPDEDAADEAEEKAATEEATTT